MATEAGSYKNMRVPSFGGMRKKGVGSSQEKGESSKYHKEVKQGNEMESGAGRRYLNWVDGQRRSEMRLQLRSE